MKKFSADFETCTWLTEETYVWAWAICEIGNESNVIIGNNIESFFEFVFKKGGTYFFHNLKFDGEFILYYLLKNEYKHIRDKKEKENKTFTTLISDMGLFYTIEIYYEYKGKIRTIKIYDSLKIIPLSVEDMAKAFGLSFQKLELDYNTPREKGYILKDYEKDYITNDVKIVACCLNEMFKLKLDKMTIGSNALENFKASKKSEEYHRLFPTIDRDLYEDLKEAYKGGFTYLNPIYEEKENKETIVLDVNSLYPSVMRYEAMPYGTPILFEGKYTLDKAYPLYIQRIVCKFDLKKDMIPTIQVKHSYLFMENEYLTSSNNELIALTLTSLDLELFLEHYNVTDLEYVCGWKFKAKHGIFDDYIDYWTSVKIKATEEKNKGLRQIAKLMLNSLYGKFATKMKVQEKIPYLDNDVVLYRLDEESEKEGLYIPIGAFITSYARNKTIRTSQAIKTYSLEKYGKDMYIYSDTDSIHTLLSIEELQQFCDIDPVRLGAWKHEATATRSKFIRQKTYLEEIDGNINITCAGMPKSCYDYVEWNTFKEGFTCGGKLAFKHIKGGVKLVETDFTIKGKNFIRNIKDF